MYAGRQVIAGAFVAHALWALFFLTGSLLDTSVERPNSQGRSMLRVVLYTIAGIAIWCFEAFVVGSAHALTLAGLALAAVCNAALLALFARGQIARRRFWARRYELVADAFRGPGALVYAAALALCVPAVIPDFSSDGVRVHLAVAFEWMRAGRIYAESRMRFPYYAFNTELTYAWLMVLGLGRYVVFFEWLAGTLACLGIEALVASVDERAQAARTGLMARAASAIYVLMPLSLMLSAVFLRWWPTAMTDALASAAFLATVAAFAGATLEEDASWLWLGALACAFLAGMKPSYIFFVPFCAVALVAAARRLGLSRVKLAALALLVLVCASPWYVRNLVRDGDPIPPIFNLALRGHDPTFTQADWNAIASDLSTRRTLAGWESFAYDEFRDPQTIEFREYGVTAVVLAVYLFPVALVLLALRRRREKDERALLGIYAWLALGFVYLIATSALTRYTLLVYPEVAAAAGLTFLRFGGSTRLGMATAVVASVLCVLPSPGSRPFYAEFRGKYYTNLREYMPSDNDVLFKTVPGYAEAEPILGDSSHSDAAFGNVLLVEAPLQYYVELHGAQPWGDWTGPGRYSDIARAVDEGRFAAYAREHRIGAAVISRTSAALAPEEVDYLIEQLERVGFVVLPSSTERFTALARRADLNKKTSAAK
ncbi:MAG: hypothetical protein KGN02_05140 [bacterium]|nr:hypothetical protein [bacterium]